MKTIDDLYNESKSIVSVFESFCKKYGFEGKFIFDHICIKCGSSDYFDAVRKMLESNSDYIFQSIVSKRRIAIIKFKKPLVSVHGDIWYLELSDQKPDNSQKDGFDHIEIIPNNIPYDGFVSFLKEKGVAMTEDFMPHHSTYEVPIGEGFRIKISHEKVVEKIKREEML